MPGAAGRAYVVFTINGRTVESDLTPAVEDMMFLVRQLEPNLPNATANELRESAITRAADAVIRAHQREGNVGAWYIRRTQ